jgi:toxin HigB-1
MEIEFQDESLDELEADLDFSGGYAKEIVKAYRKRIQAIRAANDERDLYAVRGNRMEKLKGARAHQHSMRLNDKWRLIVEIKSGNPKNTVIIIGIEDYH